MLKRIDCGYFEKKNRPTSSKIRLIYEKREKKAAEQYKFLPLIRQKKSVEQQAFQLRRKVEVVKLA